MRWVGSRARGQTGTEYMLVISVIVIAVVGAAYVFVPSFEEGVDELGRDVSQVLAIGDVGGIGHGGTNTNAAIPKNDSAPPNKGFGNAGTSLLGDTAVTSTFSGTMGSPVTPGSSTPASGLANGGSGGD